MYQYANVTYTNVVSNKGLEQMTASMNAYGQKGWRVINVELNNVNGEAIVTYEARA